MTLRHHCLPALLTSVITVSPTLALCTTPAAAAPVTHATSAPGITPLDNPPLAHPRLADTASITTQAVADCPAGWFCFYDKPNYGGHRGKLSACGYQDLAAFGWKNRIESVYYDLRNGKVTFYNDAAVDLALFTVSVAAPGDTDVNPHRDKADYVYRTC